MGEIIQFTEKLMGETIDFDFDNKQVVISRNNARRKGGDIPSISINFSDITEIEMRPAGLVKAPACSFIVNGNRLITKGIVDVDTTNFFVEKSKEKELKSTLERIIEECNLPALQTLDRASVPKVEYAVNSEPMDYPTPPSLQDVKEKKGTGFYEVFESRLSRCIITEEGIILDTSKEPVTSSGVWFFPYGSLKSDYDRLYGGGFFLKAYPNIKKQFTVAKEDQPRFLEVIKHIVDTNNKAQKYNAVRLDEDPSKKEYRKRCNVCGKVFCYTGKDVSDTINNGVAGALASIGTIANAVGGTMYGAFESDKMADRSLNKMRDFSKCPYCNSSDLTDITEEDASQLINKNAALQNTVSAADEIKKFKELLDLGAITQEEFEAKKKQLLGL